MIDAEQNKSRSMVRRDRHHSNRMAVSNGTTVRLTEHCRDNHIEGLEMGSIVRGSINEMGMVQQSRDQQQEAPGAWYR